VQMRAEIQKLQHRLATTTLYVTHDQTEAMTMGDRVAVMRHGRLVQVDAPQALYDRPADLFVAGFIGSPAMNFVRARLSGSGSDLVAEFGDASIALSERGLPRSVSTLAGREVILGLRPEHLEDAALTGSTNGHSTVEASVMLAEPVGAEVIAHFELDAPAVVTRDIQELARDVGHDTQIGKLPTERATFTARLDPRTKAARGQRLKLVIKPSSLYFFDPETESALR
jgi:multiple sugar transport system ATP-binding protein